jgi:hypothetical protein
LFKVPGFARSGTLAARALRVWKALVLSKARETSTQVFCPGIGMGLGIDFMNIRYGTVSIKRMETHEAESTPV